MDAIILPDTEYGTDIHTPHATVRPLLTEGKVGIGIQGLGMTVVITEMSPEEARLLGWEMIEIANRAESARRAGATGSSHPDTCPTCGSRGPLECPICNPEVCGG